MSICALLLKALEETGGSGYMLLIPAVRRQGQEDQEFRVILRYNEFEDSLGNIKLYLFKAKTLK